MPWYWLYLKWTESLLKENLCVFPISGFFFLISCFSLKRGKTRFQHIHTSYLTLKTANTCLFSFLSSIRFLGFKQQNKTWLTEAQKKFITNLVSGLQIHYESQEDQSRDDFPANITGGRSCGTAAVGTPPCCHYQRRLPGPLILDVISI